MTEPRRPQAVLRGRGIREAAERGSSGRYGVLRFVLFLLGLAAAVVVMLITVGGPIVDGAVYDLATSRPDSMRWPFVADIVKERLGADLTQAAGSDSTPVHFAVDAGAAASEIGQDLEAAHLIRNRFSFVYLVVTEGLSGQIQAGTYRLSAAMTPQQIVETLQQAPVQTVTIRLRDGLRLEQITAYLETLPLDMDVGRFYDLVEHPPATLLAAFPWLDLPKGRSLEGFLASDTYEVWADITPTDLVLLLVNHYHELLGDDLLGRVDASGRSLYQVVILASLVEREAALDSERALIAGVFENRLKRKMPLSSDPTVIYAHDTIELAQQQLPAWVNYYFWAPIAKPGSLPVPDALRGYQTYQSLGLPPGPICTPTAASVQAALQPDTATGYLFFVAIPDGSGRHAFARTLAEHEANLRKYGYPT